MKKLPNSIELSKPSDSWKFDYIIAPLRVVIQCPQCGKQHIDEGEWVTRVHHVHKCVDSIGRNALGEQVSLGGGCGFEWQPALIPTVGVEKLG